MVSKRFLVISESIDVNDSSASKGRVAIINNLVKIGCEVKVLHYTRKTIHLPQIECVEIKEKTLTFFYVLSRIQRVIQRSFKLNLAKYIEPLFGFSFTFFNDVNSIKAAIKKHEVSPFDLILTLSKGASFRPHYAVNKMPELHSKWMAYIHDPYPFSCYPEPYTWKDPGYKIKERFFKTLSVNAKYSAFPSLLLKDWMASFFKNFSKTGIVIPHQITEIKVQAELPNYFNNKVFTILHAGSLLKQRNPEGLIKGFQLFLENNAGAQKDSMLILIGGADHHKETIENYAKNMPQLELQLKNVSFKEVMWLQNHVSANIILEANAEASPFLPGKFPHCVSANKPIIHLGPEQSETRRLLGSDYIYCAAVTDVKRISEIIELLYLKWKETNQVLALDRVDLENYLGVNYLKNELEAILNND